jgi:hypothetical protein
MLHRIIEAVDRTSRSVGTLVRAVDTAGGVFATMIANPEAIISAGEPQALDGGDAVAFAARLAQVEAERDMYRQGCENWSKLDAPVSEFRRVLRVCDYESTLGAARRVVAERDAAIARAERAEAAVEAARSNATLVTMVGDIGVRNSGDATRLEAILAERDALAAELAAIRAVAARVRAERPACLVARAVALGVDVRVAEDRCGWLVGMLESADLDEEILHNVPAADVPATLARMLGEVGA